MSRPERPFWGSHADRQRRNVGDRMGMTNRTIPGQAMLLVILAIAVVGGFFGGCAARRTTTVTCTTSVELVETSRIETVECK